MIDVLALEFSPKIIYTSEKTYIHQVEAIPIIYVVPSQCGRHNSSRYICATSKTCCSFVRYSMVFLSSLAGFRTMGKDGKGNPPMRLNDTLSEASFEAAALIPSSAFSSACQWASHPPVIEWMITPPKFDMELQKTGLGRLYGIAV
jgi:hypothetical protein